MGLGKGGGWGKEEGGETLGGGSQGHTRRIMNKEAKCVL